MKKINLNSITSPLVHNVAVYNKGFITLIPRGGCAYSSTGGFTNIHSQFFKLSWEIREHPDPEFVILEKFSQEQLILSRNFIEWFRGFTDAEGAFIIQNDSRLAKDHNFKFIFRISLHIDDIAALEFIKYSLQIGNVRVNRKTSEVIYEVSALSCGSEKKK